MATSFAADLATLLGEAGTTVTLRTYTSVYDPATGQNTNTATDTSVSGAVSSYTVEEIAGGLVQRGDLKVTISAASAAAPTTSAKVVLATVEYSIMAVIPRYAGGAVLSYAIQARK